MRTRQPIPVFFSVDDNYIPFLAVAIRSLIDNLSEPNTCRVHILNTGLNEADCQKIRDMETDRVSIVFVDVSREVAPIAAQLNLRDYYTASIYFRIFIPSLFPQYHKAIYLDADIVVKGDIANLYQKPVGNRLLAAIPDAVIASNALYRSYPELGMGIPYKRYFNSGVMLMNLDQFRMQQIQQKFIYLLNTYGFDTVCPDQDYLNVLCRDQILYLDKGWNKMAIDSDYDGIPFIIHYNNFFKPWQYNNVAYREYFWAYAKETEFYEKILALRRSFDWKKKMEHRKGVQQLNASVEQIIASDSNFRCILAKQPIPEQLFREVVYEA